MVAVALVVMGCGANDPAGDRTTAPMPATAGSLQHTVGSKPSQTTPPPTPADPLKLPKLPELGFAVGDRRNVMLVSVDGDVLAELRRFTIAGQTEDRSGIWLQRRREFFRVEPGERKVEPTSRSTWLRDSFVSPAPPDLPVPEGARHEGVVSGHWRYALRSPVSDDLLGQWSDECEVPSAHFISPGSDPVNVMGPGRLWRHPSSHALGWTPDGIALAYLPQGACGGGGDPPGIYAFTEPGRSQLIFETEGYPIVEVWGDASRL